MGRRRADGRKAVAAERAARIVMLASVKRMVDKKLLLFIIYWWLITVMLMLTESSGLLVQSEVQSEMIELMSNVWCETEVWSWILMAKTDHKMQMSLGFVPVIWVPLDEYDSLTISIMTCTYVVHITFLLSATGWSTLNSYWKYIGW